MPNDINDVSKGNKWTDYIVFIRFVEEKTGIDFFSALEDTIEEKLETKNSGSKAEQKYR